MQIAERKWYLSFDLIMLVCAAEVFGSAWIDGNKGWLNNGVMKLGIDSTYGGAIVYVSSADSSTNLVNIYDYGRQIQQSYYAGAILDRRSEGQLANWSPWPWNPVQAGNGAWNASITLSFAAINDGTTLYSECQPRLWDMNGELAQATMQQWTQFEPGMNNVVRVDNRLICWRDAGDIWGGPVLRHQECPAVYLIRDMGKVVLYDGSQPWQNSPLTIITNHTENAPPYSQYSPTENWVACVYPSNNFGVGVYSTYGDQFWYIRSVGSSSGGATSASTMHFSPITARSMDRDTVWSYTYWIILGDVGTIRARAYELHEAELPPYTWVGKAEGDDWLDVSKWKPAGQPSLAASDTAHLNTVPGPTLYSGTASARTIAVGNATGANGRFDVRGGKVDATGLDVAAVAGSSGTVNVYGGTEHYLRYLCPGFRGSGTVNMYGGYIRVWTQVRIGYYSTAVGLLTLHGGTISAASLNMPYTGSMVIKDGVLLLDGDKVSVVQGYINTAKICAADDYELVMEYNGTMYPGQTALYARSEFNIGDFNLDGYVNMEDLAILSAQWLDVPGTPSADIVPLNNNDGIVDLLDLIMLVENWLKTGI